MTNVSLQKELMIETPNKVGAAGELTHLISDQAHSNIRALWGGVIGGKGNFAVITDNNKKVTEVLRKANFSNIREEDVIVIQVENEVGACAQIAGKLGQAGIDINWLYTTMFDDESAVVVSTKDNNKALKILS